MQNVTGVYEFSIRVWPTSTQLKVNPCGREQTRWKEEMLALAIRSRQRFWSLMKHYRFLCLQSWNSFKLTKKKKSKIFTSAAKESTRLSRTQPNIVHCIGEPLWLTCKLQRRTSVWFLIVLGSIPVNDSIWRHLLLQYLE